MVTKLQIMKGLFFIPDHIYNTIFFIYKNRYWPNFKNPRSFNEKINHIKLYSRYSLRTIAADRIRVREYVQNKAPECQLIPLLWYGSSFTKEVYDELPSKFVIKANHASGMVLIVDKSVHQYQYIKELTDKWLRIDYGKITKQWVYNDVDKILVVEEFINFESQVLPDFKFICINGKVEIIQVDLDRFGEHRRNLYDESFNRIDCVLEYPNGNDILKPILIDKALSIAKKLSEDFDIIRVDLYITKDKIYFGELTNTPGNGYDRFYPKTCDFNLGAKLKFEKEFQN